ncbi:M20/M25/M40 family metallo-hydrolase [Sandarakinorhabdus sp.]|uniref:M20/M25/M40 family metallo-hydrolase n=1 Tax=Sandarakinorhabdus sp. TaxID=1916663 RepID=UPI00286DD6E9|nr:M20/M25/M40 family metallo-hydrolase [Sandarakinorhabdus sp.]
MSLRRLGLALGLALGLGISTVAAAPAIGAPLQGDVARYRAANEQAIARQLADMIAIESVAANPAGLRKQADMLMAALGARGFAARLLNGKGGPPLVYGELKTPGAKRTVVFYAHYDGQPVEPAQWTSPPFVPVMRSVNGAPVEWQAGAQKLDPEWRLFGRAASDDKAAIAAFLTAFDAIKASRRRPSVNIKVVWEGEEEAGSPHLNDVLIANKALLAGDLWLIGDGPVHQSRRPLISFGARGVTAVEMIVFGPARALHSGHYGNWAPNPAVMAAGLVAAMRDDDGNILIPGFSDDVRAVTAAEAAAIAALPPVEADLKRDLALGRSEGSEGLTASTMRPALNVRGISTGNTGASAANAIAAQARISIDFRLVPGQTPDGVRRKVEAFLTGRGWTITDAAPDLAARAAHPRLIRLDWEGGYPALRADMTTPAARAVIAAASAAAGQPVAVLPMMGGSVPIYMFEQVFGVPIIGLPIANHDNNQHAANENLRLQNLWDGIDAYAAMIGGLDW